MTTKEKNHSLFHKLITKEDDYTQLLYNLMVRFPDFRVAVLLLFLRRVSVSQVWGPHHPVTAFIKITAPHCQRSGLNAVRSSSVNSSGCSQAAKCPPFGSRL
jgi:hypothetical protein